MEDNVSQIKKKERTSFQKPRKGSDDIMWGILLIAGGIVFLLNNLGIVPWNIWPRLIRFWPVLLILAGLQVIVGNSTVARVGMGILTLVVVLFFMLFAIVTVNPEINSHIPQFLKTIFAIMQGK